MNDSCLPQILYQYQHPGIVIPPQYPAYSSSLAQTSKKAKHVWYPNFDIKMSNFYVSVKISQIRLIFIIKSISNILFCQFPLNYRATILKNGQISGPSQKCPKFSKITSGMLALRIPTFRNSALDFECGDLPQNRHVVFGKVRYVIPLLDGTNSLVH